MKIFDQTLKGNVHPNVKANAKEGLRVIIIGLYVFTDERKMFCSNYIILRNLKLKVNSIDPDMAAHYESPNLDLDVCNSIFFILGTLTHSYLETHKRVIGEQCRPKSDAT